MRETPSNGGRPRPLRISLLHATFAAGDRAVCVRDTWLAMAERPERVEHIFAFNEDDPTSAEHAIIATGLRGPARPGSVTAVRNWNSAAATATADVLFVIADDLTPAAAGWDCAVESLIGDLDPNEASFAVKVRDSDDPHEHLMRHPLVSRAFYAQHGLFSPSYEGIGADNDFTLAAHYHAIVIDGRSVALIHEHPTRGATASTSHRAMVAEEATRSGKETFNRQWPVWKRRIWYRYYRPSPGATAIPRRHEVRQHLLVRAGLVRSFVPAWLRLRLATIRSRIRHHLEARTAHEARDLVDGEIGPVR